MEKVIKFCKDNNNLWFADIPEWTGDREQLQMVLGADTLLDIISQGENETTIYFNTEPFENSNIISWYIDGIDGDLSYGGGMYRLNQYLGITYNLDLWLCDVTKFVFGEMPKIIFFNKTI